ncbi:MAG: efflux RND transporter periplasmic adaptor subunit [Balneolaceae bacterium]
MKKQITYIFIITLLTLTACSGDPEEDRPETPDDVDIRPEVVFALADDLPLRIFIESQGVVEASREVTIRPRISGFIKESRLEDGNRISEGETILAFDDSEWRFQLQQAENDFESAQAAFNIESRQRQSRDGNNGGENDDRMVRISTGLAEAELALERAKLDMSYTQITAPVSGQLSVPERISIGTYISSGTELAKLVDDRTVLVRLDVLESEINILEAGMAVDLTSPSGMKKEGFVKAISPLVNSESKTGQVLVEVDNADRHLKPGMTVEGSIEVETHSGVARVPRSAILDRDGGRTLVFKLNGETVEWVYVEPEYATSEWAIVNHEDISPGDTLAVERHFALSHLQQVRPRMAGQIVREEVEE